jgi:hypothetical protein
VRFQSFKGGGGCQLNVGCNTLKRLDDRNLRGEGVSARLYE